MDSRRFAPEPMDEDMDEVEEVIEADGSSSDSQESDSEFEITQGTLYSGGSCAEDDQFDAVVGRLQDVVMSEEFEQLQSQFYQRNAHHFTEDEENKLIYMTIFQEYLATIERYIEDRLSDVRMDQFAAMLRRRPDEIDGPLFEMLLSFSDFQLFKEMMLDYKRSVGGLTGTAVHMEEDDDEGEERIDLSESLCITSLSTRRK